MGKFIDITNNRFGRLLVLHRLSEKRNNQILWECLCDCGKVVITNSHQLKSGMTQSCGCLRKDITSSTFKKHGMSRTRIYDIWSAMIARCYNKNNKHYKDYGGRGITVSHEWRESFQEFYNDMGEKPHGMSIDRKDNSKEYSKDNCHWATYSQQATNTRRTRMIEHGGLKMCINDWAKKLGVFESRIRSRLNRGQSMSRIVDSIINAERMTNAFPVSKAYSQARIKVV